MRLSGSVFRERVPVILAPFASILASEKSFVTGGKKLGWEQIARMGFKTPNYIRILGIGLELVCNGGSCVGISFKRD